MDSARIWSQSVARGFLVGRERTNNPSPAASSLLRRTFGKRSFRGAKGILRRLRGRRRHKGNPAPAAVALALGKLVGGSLGKRLEGRGAKDARHFAKVDELARLALLGSEEALVMLAQAGGATAQRRAYSAAKLLETRTALAAQEREELQLSAAERRATARGAAGEAAARRERREERITGVAGLAAQALLSRGRSLRRKRPRRRTTRSRGRRLSL